MYLQVEESLNLIEEGQFQLFTRIFMKDFESRKILYEGLQFLTSAGFAVKCGETAKSARRHLPFYVDLTKLSENGKLN